MSAARMTHEQRAMRDERMPVQLRPARQSDVAAIASIERLSFADPWSEQSFTTTISASHAFVRVAADPNSDAVLGYLVAWFIVDEGEIANIAVAPNARGRGIGARLLDEALDQAREQSVRGIYLEVRESNQTAQQLYASRGFVEIGRRRRYYSRPVEDALVLRAMLEGNGQ